jgi:hypothetical protein
MAIVFQQQKNEQKKLILIFFLVLIITATVLWFGYFKQEKLDDTDFISINISSQNVNINFEIFKNPLFEELSPFYQIAPFVESTSTEKLGRENPFISY